MAPTRLAHARVGSQTIRGAETIERPGYHTPLFHAISIPSLTEVPLPNHQHRLQRRASTRMSAGACVVLYPLFHCERPMPSRFINMKWLKGNVETDSYFPTLPSLHAILHGIYTA